MVYISNIQKFLKDVKINKTEDVVLLDTTGIAIASNNNDFIGKNLNPNRVNKNQDIKDEIIKNIYNHIKEFSWMDNVMKTNNGDLNENFLGNKKYIHYYRNKRSGCKIMSLVNKKEVLSSSFTRALLLLGLSIALLVISILISMKISNSIVLPIRELEIAMENGGSRDLNINIKSKDEIGKLGKVFNGMIKEFKDIVFTVRNSMDKVV